MPSNDEPEPEGLPLQALRLAMFACTRDGELDVLAELLDTGIDPNAVYFNGEFQLTALKMAADASAGQLDAVRLLLDRGADPNVMANGVTLLMTAASGDLQIAVQCH